MGKVVTKAFLSNDEDRVLIKNGQLESQLRQIECELIVDTGLERWAYRCQLLNSWDYLPRAR